MWLNLESLAVGAECRVCNAAVMANDPLRTNRSRVPESELTAPRAARSSLKSSSSTHYMGQDAMAVFAHGRARRLHHDAFGKEDRLVGQNECVLSLPESHTRRISAPSRNSWQGDQFSHCVNRGIGPCGLSCMSR
jgi:hypothetical protein